MENLTNDSRKFLASISAKVVKIEDHGMYSGVKVTLDNGMIGNGYYPAWKPLKLNIKSFTKQD